MRKYNKYNKRKKSFRLISAASGAMLIALVLVLNIGVYALTSHFSWYLDMTRAQVYSLDEATVELLSDVKDEVNIYFTVEPDKISSASPYLYYIYRTALELEAKFDCINVECIDIIKNPGFFKSFYNTAAQDILSTSVVVESGTEFRLYHLNAFFVTNDSGNIWAYQGEYTFASAVLSLTQSEMPPVYFTASHGERIGSESEALRALFADAGYEVKDIDLSREDISADGRIIIVNDPLYDFAGSGSDTNEIEKLDKFLDDFGCLIVFTSPERAGRLTNLSEFLAEWGISFTPDTYVRDRENSLTADGKTLSARYEKDTLGASLYLDLSALDTMPKTILRNAMPLNILWDKNDGVTGSREASVVLTSYETSEAVKDGEVSASGRMPLMTISRDTQVLNNNTYYSYVLACGSSDYSLAQYLKSNTYANSDILYNTARLTGRDRVLADIDIKVLDDTSLDITTAQANRWTIAVTFALPVIVAVAGIAVHVRRKHK